MGTIVGRFEQRGLRLVAMKFMQMSSELASRHYAIHKGKPFYEPLIKYITSGPVLVMVWEANDAIAIVRTMMGSTRPAEAQPGTIRGDFGLEVGRNIVHGSDGPETASFEIDLFFDQPELVDWERSVDGWIFE
jgi:nucleoside-diphosphate kinase